MILFLIRAVHTIIYIIMASAVIFSFYCGVFGIFNWVLYWSLALVMLEGIIFFMNGMKCPLTDLAKKHGAVKGYVFDTFLPEKFSRYTFQLFGTLFVLAIILLLFHWN